MQTVSSAFTAEETDRVRRISHDLRISWKKDYLLGNKTFTIGVSTIGGSDIIGINPGAIGGPGNYRYFDESEYVQMLAWDRSLNLPQGGLTKALAEAVLDNTSGRFTPSYMGGESELFTSILPSRPTIISAGFELGGISQVIPQFSGIVYKQPKVDKRMGQASLQMADYVNFFQNRYLDNSVMFTGQRSDLALERILQESGMSTAQYRLDEGINVLNFAVFEKGDKFADVIDRIVSAEYGHFYQDEEGVFRFENRQHWDTTNGGTRLILTADVLESETPGEDHIINVVEIKSQPRAKQESQVVFKLSSPIEIPASSSVEYWVDFDDPMVFLASPVFTGNSQEDGSGSDQTGSIALNSASTFTRSAKYIFRNTSGSTVYITSMSIIGRPAKVTEDLYYRDRDSSSVTAFDERPYVVENDYIQDISWARSFATLLLQDFSEPESLHNITVRAKPSMQLGDLVTWQGITWRVYGIRARITPQEGFVQELKLVKRPTRTNFTIGVSLIGGSDIIAA